MKVARIIFLLAISITLVGCSYYYGPREQVKAFVHDKSDLLGDIISKVEFSPTLASIAEAQKLVDEKKASLQEQRQAISNAEKGFNRDWLTSLLESEVTDGQLFKRLNDKLEIDCTKGRESCTDMLSKFNELRKSYMIATRLPGYKPDEKP